MVVVLFLAKHNLMMVFVIASLMKLLAMKSCNKSARIYFCCDWHFKGYGKICHTIWAYLLEQFELNL